MKEVQSKLKPTIIPRFFQSFTMHSMRFMLAYCKCGGVYNVRDEEQLKIDICDGKAAVEEGCLMLYPNCNIRTVSLATGAVLEKRLSDGQVR